MKPVNSFRCLVMVVACLFFAAPIATAEELQIIDSDSMVNMQVIQITAIKQGLDLKKEAISSTTLTKRDIDIFRIGSVKQIITQAPNFYIPDYGSRMTSAIYVRGLGSRMENTAAGMNVDNIPLCDKSLFDMQMPDIEKIEIIRGPQSQLYGRNSMGGIINVYTTSPLSYQGARIHGEYSSRNSFRVGAAAYAKYTNYFGASVAAEFSRQGAFFKNTFLGRGIDDERNTYCRLKGEYLKNNFKLSNILSFSILNQGGYPYRYEGSLIDEEKYPEHVSKISYNEESTYDRKGITYGCIAEKKWDKMILGGVLSYQYLDDKMHMDNDFLPLDFFIMEQNRHLHDINLEAMLRSSKKSRYEWIVGCSVFLRHSTIEAPVNFRTTGIEELILRNINQYGGYDGEYRWGKANGEASGELPLENYFKTRTLGCSAYHTSTLKFGAVKLSCGIRIDAETARMKYNNIVNSYYTAFPSREGQPPTEVNLVINDEDVMDKSFVQFLPKFSITYELDGRKRNMLYATISKGYKPGGFNTQMFSEVLERKVKNKMGLSTPLDVDKIISYKPEKSWTYEIGGHFETNNRKLTASFALFYINCTDQQLTIFPQGQTTGRMTTNAGETRSLGCEASIYIRPTARFEASLNYGYTNAIFTKFISANNDYHGKHVPYAPCNTLSGILSYAHPLQGNVLNNITLSLRYSGAGRIFWNESNTSSQSFYSLMDLTLRFGLGNVSLDLWTQNLLGTKYDVFYFESMGNQFLQSGRPRTFGIRINFKFLEK